MYFTIKNKKDFYALFVLYVPFSSRFRSRLLLRETAEREIVECICSVRHLINVHFSCIPVLGTQPRPSLDTAHSCNSMSEFLYLCLHQTHKHTHQDLSEIKSIPTSSFLHSAREPWAIPILLCRGQPKHGGSIATVSEGCQNLGEKGYSQSLSVTRSLTKYKGKGILTFQTLGNYCFH